MMVHKRNYLLFSTVGKTQYLTWWHIADIAPQHQMMCETMARLICYTSLLEEDDPKYLLEEDDSRYLLEEDDSRYRGVSNSARNCSR